jgi:Xaa-Pro aminopeptidase
MKKQLSILICLLLFAPMLLAQSKTAWVGSPLGAEFHKTKRDELRKKMPPNSVCAVFSYPIRNKSNDINYSYHQNPNLYYLTGIRQAGSLLLLFSTEIEINGQKTNEIIFTPERDPKDEIWHEDRLGLLRVKEQYKIQTVMSNSEINSTPINWKLLDNVWVDIPKDLTMPFKPQVHSIEYLLVQFERIVKENNIKYDKVNFMKHMAAMREIKSAEEIALLKKSVEISCKAFNELIKAIQPGMYEYQAQAIAEYVIKYEGASDVGYPSIVGSGENACVLHYTRNREKLLSGELLLVDIGAEYKGYSADITRTIPVNGIFSPEQKAIYNLVLEAQNAAIKASVQGASFYAPHSAAYAVISKGLKDLGIIKKESDASQYFMHGTSHHLGLDVHDKGGMGALKVGMFITIEPGIYIKHGADCDPKWWNIGVRIEDDILITETEAEVFSKCIPRSIEEIEALMQTSQKN